MIIKISSRLMNNNSKMNSFQIILRKKLVNNQNLEESKYLLMKVASKFAISFK